MRSIPAAILDVSAPLSASSKPNGHQPSDADLSVVTQSFTDLLSVQTPGSDGKAKRKNVPTEQDANLSKTAAVQSPSKVNKAGEERYAAVSIAVPPLAVLEVSRNGAGKSPSHASLEKNVETRSHIGRSLNPGAGPDAAAGDGTVMSGPQSAEAHLSASEKISGTIAGKDQSSEETQAPNNGAGTPKLPGSGSGSTRSRDGRTTSSTGEVSTDRPALPLASSTSMTAAREGSGFAISDLSHLSKESLPAQASSQAKSAKGGLAHSKPALAEPARLTGARGGDGAGVKGSPISTMLPAHVAQITTEPSVKASASNPSVSSSGSLDVRALSEAVLRPISAGGGNHTLLVAMHPAELGHLEAVVSLNQNGIQVSLMPQTAMGHTALANSVEALKSQLAQGGMNVNVTLRDPGSQPGNEARHQRQQGAPVQPTQPLAAKGASSSSSVASASGQIHLVL